MLALYRADRQAEALQAYTDARRPLVGDLGIEPGEHLRELERQILAQDPALALPPPETLELPPELDSDTPLAGRAEDVAWLREHWRRARAGAGATVVVTGPHGIGKTRLAGELARDVYARARRRSSTRPGPTPRAARARWRARSARRGRRCSCSTTSARRRAASSGSRPPGAGRRDRRGPRAGAGRRDEAARAARRRGDVGAIARQYAPRARSRSSACSTRAAASPARSTAPPPRGRAPRPSAGWTAPPAARPQGAPSLRVAEDELAGSVVELQALRERAAAARDARRRVPVQGPRLLRGRGRRTLFFGRERLVAEMVARLPGAPLMGIVGPSGSGKSSALRAGLLAALRGRRAPGQRVVGGVAAAPRRASAARAQRVARAPRGREVIAVDQFEEIFTACHDEAERAAFVGRAASRPRATATPARWC